jgi:hypothetical protein
MRLRFLTIAMAIAGLFTAQQAVAKNHTKSAKSPKSASAKKHKKHTKKADAASTAVRAA